MLPYPLSVPPIVPIAGQSSSADRICGIFFFLPFKCQDDRTASDMIPIKLKPFYILQKGPVNGSMEVSTVLPMAIPSDPSCCPMATMNTAPFPISLEDSRLPFPCLRSPMNTLSMKGPDRKILELADGWLTRDACRTGNRRGAKTQTSARKWTRVGELPGIWTLQSVSWAFGLPNR